MWGKKNRKNRPFFAGIVSGYPDDLSHGKIGSKWLCLKPGMPVFAGDAARVPDRGQAGGKPGVAHPLLAFPTNRAFSM